MIFTTPGSLAGCRDREGLYVPVPQCNPVSMKYWGKNSRITYKKKKTLKGGLSYGQLPPAAPLAPDPGSYQQIWDVLRQTCVSMAGEDACNRLLGHTPFVCPVEEPRKGSFLIPLLIGVAIGKIIL